MDINIHILNIGCFYHWGMNNYTELIKYPTDLKNTDGYKILVVEDDDVAYLLLNEILDLYRPIIFRASNGEEAINYFSDNKHAADLVLMDIRLPKVNGYQATRRIKEINPTVPVVAVTAYAHSQGILDCYLAGCDDYLAKPFEIRKLQNIIENYLFVKN